MKLVVYILIVGLFIWGVTSCVTQCVTRVQ